MGKHRKGFEIMVTLIFAAVFYLGVFYGEYGSHKRMAFGETPPPTVAVQIEGAVEAPGYYELPQPSRLHDLFELAHPLADADIAELNPARYLRDGETIEIAWLEGKEPETQNHYTQQEALQTVSVPDQTTSALQSSATAPEQTVSAPQSSATAPEQIVSASQSSAAELAQSTSAPQSDKININTASAAELMQLSGIGEVKSWAIVSYREEHGAFSRISDIKKVKGIGDATYAKIKDHICGK